MCLYSKSWGKVLRITEINFNKNSSNREANSPKKMKNPLSLIKENYYISTYVMTKTDRFRDRLYERDWFTFDSPSWCKNESDLKIFLLITMKKCTRSLKFCRWLELFECFIFEYISFSTSPARNCYDYMRFSVRIWFTYGSLMVHLGEPFWLYEISSSFMVHLSFT